MTIDEVIEKLKSDAIIDNYNFQGYSMKQKEQIAEWLEELKERRESDFNCVCLMDKRYTDGYNTAIDAFAQVLSYKIKLEIDDCADELEWVNEIAEQLKSKTKL